MNIQNLSRELLGSHPLCQVVELPPNCVCKCDTGVILLKNKSTEEQTPANGASGDRYTFLMLQTLT
jgi:hypothetical protein